MSHDHLDLHFNRLDLFLFSDGDSKSRLPLKRKRSQGSQVRKKSHFWILFLITKSLSETGQVSEVTRISNKVFPWNFLQNYCSYNVYKIIKSKHVTLLYKVRKKGSLYHEKIGQNVIHDWNQGKWNLIRIDTYSYSESLTINYGSLWLND